VKFGTALVFGVSATGDGRGGGRERDSEKRFQRRLRKPFRDERNHRASWSFGDIHGKGIPPRTTETKVLDCSVARVA